jgi:drug/metabolite transporter (DMT)-like permease
MYWEVASVAVLLALSSSVLWGSADFFGGLLSRRRSVLAVTWGSQAVALLAVVITTTALGSWAAPASYLWYGVIAGALGSLGILAFYRALALGPMGLVAAVASTSVILPVLAGLLQGDRPHATQYGGIALAIAGVVLASGPEFRSGQRVRSGTMGLALLAALGFGGYFWAMAEAADHNLSMVLVTQRLTNLVIGAVLLIGTSTAVRFARGDLPMLIFVGLGDVAANATYALATRYGSLAVVAVLASLYPLVTALLARMVLGERLRRIQQVGAAAAMTGALILAA